MKNLIYVILFSMITILSCKAQEQTHPVISKTYPIDSLNELLYKSMMEKKVTMIGDGYHAHWYFLQTVTNILNYWLDKIESDPKNTTIPKNLILFLEKSPSEQALLDKAITSGEIYDYLSYQIESSCKYGGLGRCSTDNIEFISDIRDIQKRIESLNKKLTSKITFKILPADNEAPYSIENGITDFIKKKDDWFAFERDKQSSGNIIHELEKNQDCKALVFIGSAHLTRTISDKSFFCETTDSQPKYSYYMAHYLDEHFGRNLVNVFNPLFSIGTKSYGTIAEYEKSDSLYDYVFQNGLNPINPFPVLYFISSKQTLKILSELHNKYFEYGLNRDSVYGPLDLMLESAFRTAIRKSYLFEERPEIKGRFDSLNTYYTKIKDHKEIFNVINNVKEEAIVNFDAVKNIKEIGKWIITPKLDQLINKMKLPNYPNLKSIIYNLPCDTTDEVYCSNVFLSEDLIQIPRLRSSGQFSENNFGENRYKLNDFEIGQIKKRTNDIILYSLINLLWIATPEEKSEAINSLKEMTGLNYNSAKEWTNWWRSKFLSAKAER
ncbi:MAG: hypothetical protein Q8933_18720 [Bacteroidota bacterium]|nr:hypothetical protein [Bacteroidota bacterium]